MTRRKVTSLYYGLWPVERFQLTMDAQARGDWDDVDRLIGSCPQFKYWCKDLNYVAPMIAAPVIAFAASSLLFRGWAALQRPMVCHEFLEEASVARAELDLPENAEDSVFDSDEWNEIEDLYRARVADLIGVCDGIARFCAEIGVEPAVVLALEGHCLPVWQFAARLPETHCSNEALAESAHDGLAGLWSAMVPEAADPVADWRARVDLLDG
jgi:hypothetical protein